MSTSDVINSIADGLQYISYFHPIDFITALDQAYKAEESVAAKDAIAQILVNSRMCAIGKRPLCQDTGIVVVFLKVGMNVSWQGDMSLQEMVDEGVRRAYSNPENPLRASIINDPAGSRQNTGDNTPAVVHTEIVVGDKVEITLAAKGGGSENKAKFVTLNPSDSIVDWVVKTLSTLGAGWCPPGILGIGIGGSAEKAMLLAKQSLMAPIDIQTLLSDGATTTTEQLRLDIYHEVNKLGIGAQGLGGLVTLLDVKVLDYPAHAASKPVALIPNCAATRHLHFVLDGNGPAIFTPPDISIWPKISLKDDGQTKLVNLDTLSKEEISRWKPGDSLLLSGHLLTGRDAAHKQITHLIEQNKPLPVDFSGRFIYYVGPVDAVRDEVVGPAGPTTASRMDKFTEPMLAQAGLWGMIGKAERGPEAIASIKKHQAVYLIATGGAAYLVSKAIKSSKIVAFEELGMEAIREFEIVAMPVTVAVDTRGQSIHEIGPRLWREKIQRVNLSKI
ncbi:MAG: fumarate hydratase [Thiohalomonadales bacterium]